MVSSYQFFFIIIKLNDNAKTKFRKPFHPETSHNWEEKITASVCQCKNKLNVLLKDLPFRKHGLMNTGTKSKTATTVFA